MSKVAVIKSADVERRANELLVKFIYAGFKDIESNWNGPEKVSTLTEQTYDNLIKDKKDRSEGLTSRFTLSAQIAQYLGFFFKKMLEEIKLIQVTNDDTLATLKVKLDAANAECYTLFMYGVNEQFKADFGPTLVSASDPQLWFSNQIIGSFGDVNGKQVALTLIATEFINFLKSLAYFLGKILWHIKCKVSNEFFIGSLFQLRMSQDMLDNLHLCLREKVVKPRKKTAAKTASGEATPGTASETSTPGSSETTTPVESGTSTPAEPASSVADADDVNAFLLSVDV